MGLCDFRRIIEISDKINTQEIKRFLGVIIKSAMNISGVIFVRVLVSQQLSKPIGSCIIYFF